MKKIICFVLVMATIFLMTSCNQGIGLGNLSFKHIHFSNAVSGRCATVEKWYESEDSGIEVKTKEYGAIWCSEGTYIMFESGAKCPYC